MAWINSQNHTFPTDELEVYERVRGGLATGLFYGLPGGVEPQEVVNLGWGHSALLTIFPGETTIATLDQVQASAKDGPARI